MCLSPALLGQTWRVQGGDRIMDNWGAPPLQFSPLLLASLRQKVPPTQSTLTPSPQGKAFGVALSLSWSFWALPWGKALWEK